MYSVRKEKMLGLLNSRQHFLNTIRVGEVFFYLLIPILCNLFPDIVMFQVIRSLLHSFFHAAVEDEILTILKKKRATFSSRKTLLDENLKIEKMIAKHKSSC